MLIGSVLGPMVICGVCFLNSKLDFLSKIGVRDSKKLNPKRRSELAKVLIPNCHSYKVIIVNPQEIDQREVKRITLNHLEELKMADIINSLKPDTIYIDAVDVNEERFGVSIKNLLTYKPKKIISKHKADDLYPIVSAGSIIAKVRRDALIEDLKEVYGDFGSGYPSDVRTITFLKDYIQTHKKPPKIARKSWDTTKKIITNDLKTRKITDFLK